MVYRERYREFLHRLRKARVEAGFTQAQLALCLGKPQSFISKCESGERRIDVIELQDIAMAIGKPIGYFLDDEAW